MTHANTHTQLINSWLDKHDFGAHQSLRRDVASKVYTDAERLWLPRRLEKYMRPALLRPPTVFHVRQLSHICVRVCVFVPFVRYSA